MRMSKSGLSAYDVVNEYSKEQLEKILFEYGEEKFAHGIVSGILKARETAPIKTTLELAEIEGTNYYRLTEKGIEGAEKFKKLVPKSFRDKIYAAGLRLFVKLKNDRDVSFDIKPAKRGYNVHCRCCDDDMVLMDITLYAPDQEQANYIKSKIQMNPTDFYCRVVDYIIENEEYVPSAAEEQGLF